MMFRTLYRMFLLIAGGMLGETVASYTAAAGHAGRGRDVAGWLAGGAAVAAVGMVSEYAGWRHAMRRWRQDGGRSV